MERGNYLTGQISEPDRLMIFYSTVDRKRGTTKLYMVGNSISRVCPYIKDWGLDKIFRNLKQGEIATKIIHNEENDVKIAIEYCKSSGGKTMTIGNASNMIDSGAWQTSPQPKLPKSKKEYNVLFRCGFSFKGFSFLGEYLEDKETKHLCWFIFPYESKEFKDDLIVFSDIIKTSPYWQRNIYDISINNKKLQNIFNTFREDIIFFSDDLCGTDFKQVIDFSIRR